MALFGLGTGCEREPLPVEPTPPKSAPPTESVGQSPSVLLVILDTVRADAFTPERMPVLHRLAGQGALYANAHTASTWSWPSHASLFLGMPPWEHGAHFDRGGVQWGSNDPVTVSMPRIDTPTLAERFSEAGYATAMLTANPWLRRDVGLDRGYDSVAYDQSDDKVVEYVRGGLKGFGGRPLFLTVNLMSAHAPFALDGCTFTDAQQAALDGELGPYVGPQGLTMTLGETMHDIGAFVYARGELSLSAQALDAIQAAYWCDVQRADAQLGAVLDAWVRAGQRGVIAVTSDHGEMLGEHGQFEHGRGVWPELSHVPLVVAAPGRLPAGTREDAVVMQHHLYGTLLSLAGLARPDDPTLHGVETRQVKAWSDRMWAEHVGGRYAHDATLVASNGWVRVAWGDQEFFYDGSSDPRLTQPLPSPEGAEQLRAVPFTETEAPRLSPVLDEQTRGALEALGYLPREDEPASVVTEP